jgi:hypothetical protein
MGGDPSYPSSWRLFRAHPALGLEETDHDFLPPLSPHELGVRWWVLEPDEQRQREADFAAALERAATQPDSGLTLELESSPVVRGVWMDRWKAPALQRELLDHVWDEAERRRGLTAEMVEPDVRRRREVERTLRARVLVLWSEHSGRLVGVFVAAVVLGWLPFVAGWLAAVALLAVGLGVVFLLDRLVRRWYQRAARATRRRRMRAGGP